MSKSNLRIISSIERYREEVMLNRDNILADLYATQADYQFDIVYARADNVVGRPLYNRAGAFLRQPAANALAAANADFHAMGLGICIYDAYRPYSITCQLWEAFHDPRYVADPACGSRHNRGCSIDMSLYSLATGKMLVMPTEYDDFSERAHHSCTDLPQQALANRALLKEVMLKHHFNVFATEWWHYDFDDWEHYSLMDIPFESLTHAS